MSDKLLFEIQGEIMKRLPVKSVIRFRSVSKQWKSLIHSSRFIADYSKRVQQLLVRFRDPADNKDKYVSVVDDDDDAFPQQDVSLTVHRLVQMLKYDWIMGSSHGLLCLFGGSNCNGRTKDAVVLWNVSIRKAIAVLVPNVPDTDIFRNVVGFGVCRETNDFKIVKITQIKRWMDLESISCIPRQVEVFTLSTGTWRSPYSTNLPRKSIDFELHDVVAMDGVFYWLASDRITLDDGFWFIVSFDMTSEEFREITLPDSVAQPHLVLCLYKLKDSLVVIEYDHLAMTDFVVWKMVNGVPESFTKLFTIPSSITPNRDVLVTGFRKSGEPIIEVREEQGGDRAQLAVYEPYSKHINNLGFDGRGDSFFVHPYMETLYLLNQPNLKVYNGSLRRRAKNKWLLKHVSKVYRFRCNTR